jgi:drug/metabolite transporter (DMT)-like permease
MKTTLQLAFGLGIAAGLFAVIHYIVGGDISRDPTPKGLFSMEIAIFVILLGSFVAAEIRSFSDSAKPHEPRLRNIFFLLVAFLGSGGVFMILVMLLNWSNAMGKTP